MTIVPHRHVRPYLHPHVFAVSNKVSLCSKVNTDDLPSDCQEKRQVALEPVQHFFPDWSHDA
jgi:hypothetical protein